jgi:hypothetical protein
MRARRLTTTVTAVAAAVLASCQPAHGEAWGGVDCTQQPRPPQCQVTVIDPGDGGDLEGGGGGGGEPVCRIDGQVVACHEPGLGWLHSDGCYHRPDPRIGPGPNWWERACHDPGTDSYYSGGWVWRQAPPASLAPVVQRAVDLLTIPRPQIAASPALDAVQVVRVPVWWWIEPGTWHTRTATAAIPALTITAQATPTQATWHAGDGTSITCHGPGTPWTPHQDPGAASPTCGHTYTTASGSGPGGTYTVRAELSWAISWTGGGMNGTLPAITTSTTAQLSVVELRSVVTG